MQAERLEALLDRPFTVTLRHLNQIHAHIIAHNLPHLLPLLIRQTLKSAAHYSPAIARHVKSILFRLHNQDVFTASFTIRYFSRHGQYQEAFTLYAQMQRLGVLPNTFAVSSALKSCGRLLSELGGTMIHGQVEKCGLCKFVFVQTALVDFYCKVGKMSTARKVFDGIRGKNVVTWSSLLAGYVKYDDLAMAQSVFDEMPVRNVISWNLMVSGYTRRGDMEHAYELFQKMPERNSSSWNTMIAGYVECGKIEFARKFFDAMPDRDNVSYITMISAYSRYGVVESARELFDRIGDKGLFLYNAMIACFAQNNQAKKALELFDEIVKEKVKFQPDKMTLSSAVSACAQLGDLTYGTWIESLMRELGIGMDDHLATSFIDLYTKCGNLDKAYELFNGLKKRDLFPYNAMILGCGINGRAKEAIQLFEEMIDAGVIPDQVTFRGILTAYCHVGMVEEGYHCFKSMERYGLVPSQDHYSIVVDLFGRAGRLEEAYKFITKMPVEPHAGVWGALLLACSLHHKVEIAEIAAKNCFELDPDCRSYPSLLANIYASVGRRDDAQRLRDLMEEKGLVRIPGSSWMEFETA